MNIPPPTTAVNTAPPHDAARTGARKDAHHILGSLYEVKAAPADEIVSEGDEDNAVEPADGNLASYGYQDSEE
ncbi:hypothetical protein [Streptomyces sp. 3N207]|uniref:hypothetical protein n=1 Tax=Streptomyces sp. 3N207 TaxID=3457417 RepID=UPI003FD320ED